MYVKVSRGERIRAVSWSDSCGEDLKIGAHLANARPWATADSILTLGTRAEALGFDSVWVSDEVVISGRIDSWHPYSPTGV